MKRTRFSSLATLGAALAVPALCQNMLTNGGFEYGMVCNGIWQVSQTFVDFAGDYRFSLSTDAHSGTYSAQITCTGSDCGRGQIDSDYIPVTTPGQSYAISAWAKCAPGEVSYIYVDGTVGGNANIVLPCTGSWAKGSGAFQPGPSASVFSYQIFYFGQTTFKVDDVVLTYADGTAPAHTQIFPGVRNTGISGNAITVDGSPHLALGFFDVAYADLPTAAATGANTINGLNTNNNTDCLNFGQVGYLDRTYQLGMNFVPDASLASRVLGTDVFVPLGQRYSSHLANISWFLDDEPDLWPVPWFVVPPATMQTQYNNLKTQTNLPVHADFQRSHYGSPSDDAPYASAVDFWMGEPYGPDFSSLAYNVNFFNSISPRPMWFAQDDVGASLIVPKAYWAIVNGVTGIFYFDWNTFKADPPALAAVTQAFGELNSLKNAIFGAKIDGQVTAPAGITTMSRYYQGNNYILAVNPNTATVSGTFSVAGLPSGVTVTVLNEGRTITSVPGGFSDTFTGIARHAYSIPNSAFPTITAFKVLFGSQSYNILNLTRHHLPWQITGIQAQFSSAITSASASSLGGVSAIGFLGLGTQTLTWTFAPISDASLTLSLSGSGGNAITDASGNPLGGGAGFSQALHVLWGDFNDDALVSAQDLAAVNSASHAPYNPFADLNGDGLVNAADVLVARNRTGTIQQ